MGGFKFQMSSHVSDHSVMQFRQQLLQNVPELDWCQGSLCEVCPAWYKEYRTSHHVENKHTSESSLFCQPS
jgi:hypothetical protein